jgi:hypothetical protein
MAFGLKQLWTTPAESVPRKDKAADGKTVELTHHFAPLSTPATASRSLAPLPKT